MSTRIVAVSAITSLALLSAAPAVATPSDSGSVSASYIVQFSPGSDRAAEVSKAKALGMTVTYEYTTALNGMAVKANAGQLRALQSNPNVTLVEADGVVTISDTQPNPPWGLDRSDQRDLPLSATYSYATGASNVTAYIIDTGILAGHSDFGNRVSGGHTAIDDGRGTTDCNGHGTHVAGTVGGSTYGMAKGVKLVPVRVLGCDGSGAWSGVIAGIDWVAANADKPAVANMSLGGGKSTSVNSAVAQLVSSGVTTVVAAGNSNANACNSSPASEPTAVTVGATGARTSTGALDATKLDSRADYSNYGSCLDIFAPGSGVTSAWYTSTTATNTISGTSMASPHVAGAAALYLTANSAASPSAVANALISDSTPNKVISPGTGSPNRLLFVAGGSTTPPPPPPPVEAVAPSAPTNLSASNVTKTEATLTWALPTTGTAPFTYSLRYGVSGKRGAVTWLLTISGLTATSQALTGLSPRTKYVWQVTAANTAGEGPAAASSFTTRR
jgi:subtilisin family serine protease